ncbi:predicted protein [Histoplasma capsulatum H143]|uniref:Uncharacterized protein n=1 Tax=Ajellomyces capsulatus (strain H143) TaxID=544712 RepID=C6HGQ9_AJECH|nr:predicted protein [Histoplasma capsulatum H143]
MNQDSPDVDEDKKEDIGKFLQGEEEGEIVVGDTLSVAVDGVEGVGGVRAWHNPFVVGLMQVLIDEGVVKAAVDPVDEEVGEDDEERELEVVVERKGSVFEVVVHFCIPADLEEEDGSCEDGHDWEGD